MASARRFYRLSLLFGVAGAAGLTVAIVSALRSVSFAPLSAQQLLRACQDVVFSGQTASSAIVLVLAGVGAAVLVLAIRSGIGHYRAQRAVLRGLPVLYVTSYRQTPLTVFAQERPEAFCAGLLRPRVYLSRAALERVSDDQLAAVIEHEIHHCRRRDPLRILTVQVLSDCLFFLPVMHRLRDRYCMLAELAADEAAVGGTGDRAALAATLLAFAEGPAGVVGIAPERVDHLLGRRPRWELSVSLLAGAAITLAGLTAMAMLLARTATPGTLSSEVLAGQTCMIAMAVVPVLLGASLVAITSRRRRGAEPR